MENLYTFSYFVYFLCFWCLESLQIVAQVRFHDRSSQKNKVVCVLDSQGLNPSADRVDVTLIEPSGQVYTATTGNQGESQHGTPSSDLSSLIGPIVQQIAAASAGLATGSQPQSQATDPQTLPATIEAAVTVTAPTPAPVLSGTTLEPQQDSGLNAAPATDARTSGAGRGLSLGAGRGGPTLSRGPTLGSQARTRRAPAQAQNESARVTGQSQTNTTGSGGQPGIMSLLGSMIQRPPGGGDANQPQGTNPTGGGLSQLLSNMMNNPAVQRMAENPEILRMVDNVMGGGSDSQDAGDMMSRLGSFEWGCICSFAILFITEVFFLNVRVGSQVIPMMTQMLGGGSQQQQQGAAHEADIADQGSVLCRELGADEAARWTQVIHRDLSLQNSATPQECLSEAYLAGEGFVRTGGLSGLLSDLDEMDEDKNETV